jgi:NAD(P)H-dependent flavin oxidoreductase YrpB (nitropropane dioxygenase family)
MTRFTDLVGCRHPIQLAAMSRAATPALAAGVSNLGGLGMLAMGRPTRAEAERQVDAALALTNRPLGAGFIVLFLDRQILEDVAGRLPVIEFFWGWPDRRLVLDGVITGWQVGSVDEAKAAADAGCRYVIAQGVEAGGHVRGVIPLSELVPAVRAAVDIPVVAAGGIGTAAAVRTALLRGADAVRIGTRFVATIESDAHDRYVDLLVASSAGDTVLTERFDVGWPDAPVRVLRSALAAAEQSPDGIVARMVTPDGTLVEIPRFSTTPPNRATTGNLDAMALYAGTSVDAVTERATLAAVMNELVAGTQPEGTATA